MNDKKVVHKKKKCTEKLNRFEPTNLERKTTDLILDPSGSSENVSNSQIAYSLKSAKGNTFQKMECKGLRVSLRIRAKIGASSRVIQKEKIIKGSCNLKSPSKEYLDDLLYKPEFINDRYNRLTADMNKPICSKFELNPTSESVRRRSQSSFTVRFKKVGFVNVQKIKGRECTEVIKTKITIINLILKSKKEGHNF